MSTARHTVILDWDGTLVPQAWPERPTEFMPGAVEAVKAFHRAGFHMKVFTARLTPLNPWTGNPVPPAHVFEEKQYIRQTLDNAGLTYVDIWDKPGKPSGSVYVDDKGERYGGRPGSWDKLAQKILLRLGAEEAVFPIIEPEEAAA